MKRTLITNNAVKKQTSKPETQNSEIPKRVSGQPKPGGDVKLQTDSNDNNRLKPSKSQTNNGIVKKRTANGDSLLPKRNMSRISEETNDVDEEIHYSTQFPNLIDSVHVTENRLTTNNINQYKYILPTTYIGKLPDPKGKESSNLVRTNINDKRKMPQISGIPIPKNTSSGRNKSLIAMLLASKKTRTTGIPMKVKNNDTMTKSVHLSNGNFGMKKDQPSVVTQLNDIDSPTHR